MNSIMEEYYPVFEMYQAMRAQLMDILSDEELDFRVGGDSESLGALCREMGEVEHSYIQSFKTFEHDFTYKTDEPGLESSVKKLAAWFKALDEDLKATIAGLSEGEIRTKTIHRGGDFHLPPRIQLDVYKEALLIFYGKVSVYLKAMNKPRPKQWQEWIG